jgi:hypothetical protein
MSIYSLQPVFTDRGRTTILQLDWIAIDVDEKKVLISSKSYFAVISFYSKSTWAFHH